MKPKIFSVPTPLIFCILCSVFSEFSGKICENLCQSPPAPLPASRQAGDRMGGRAGVVPYSCIFLVAAMLRCVDLWFVFYLFLLDESNTQISIVMIGGVESTANCLVSGNVLR